MTQNFATGEYGLIQSASNGSSIVTTQKHSGTSSYTVNSGSTSNYGSFLLAGTSAPAVRAYVYVTSVTPGLYNNHLFYITDNSSQAKIGFKISGGGFLTLTTGTTNGALTTLNTSAITFPTNTWVRLELRTSGTNTYAAAWYLGDSAVAQDSWSGTAAATINGATYYTFGAPYNMGGYAAPGYWDDMASNSVSEFIGPATSILVNNFEGMTNSQTLSTTPTGGNGNTAINGYNGTFGGVATNLYAHSGTLSLRQPIGTTQSWSMANVQTDTVAARGYFMFQSPVTNTDLMFMALTSNGTAALTVALSIAGSYQQDGLVLLGGTTQNVPLQYTSQGFINSYLNQWLRIEIAYTFSTGAYYWGVFLSDSTTALYTATGTLTSNPPSTAPNRVDIGKLQTNGASGTVTNYWVDDVALRTDSAIPIGPVSTTPSTTTVVQTVASTFNVNSAVSTTASSTFNIRTSVYNSYSSTFNVLSRANQTQSATYAVNQGVSSILGSTYGVSAQVSSTQASTFNLSATISSAKGTTWQVLKAISANIEADWSATSSVLSTLTSSYALFAGVESDQAFDWGIRTPITATFGSTYRVSLGVSQVQGFTYGISSTLTSTLTSTYAVHEAVTNVNTALTSTFVIYQRVAQTSPSQWNVSAQIAATRGTNWNVLSTLSVPSTAFQWNVYTSVSPSLLPSTWVMQANTVFVLGSTWQVLERAEGTQEFDWRVNGPISIYPITGTINSSHGSASLSQSVAASRISTSIATVTIPRTEIIGENA